MLSLLPTSAENSPLWQRELAAAIRDPAELLKLLQLSPSALPTVDLAVGSFPLRVPRSFVKRMRIDDPQDPLLRQVLPTVAEHLAMSGYLSDPVGDLPASQAGGILHKYHGRVLLITTGACAIHCRYCFRRHFPYTELRMGEFNNALAYLEQHQEVSEVILSGGDPLMLNDQRLAELTHKLAEIPHLQRLRIHSRLPIVLPSRIDEHLLDWFAGSRLQPVLVVHANHPQELDNEVAEAASRLRERGVFLLNQTVLLAGINDDADTLIELSKRLFASGIQPYYLHALDKVQGAQHFNNNDRLKSLIPIMRARLPGYLVPQAVCEEAGQASKTPL
ncbi:MAG: EF-P beta-lysylation protein EpmB [Thiohalomonadaceae bacterium]